jgi:hypothetical protein
MNLCFGAVLGDGLFGKTTDTSLNIAQCLGLGPVLPWIYDTIWIQILQSHLASYNKQRAQMRKHILKLGGIQHKGAGIWYNSSQTASGQTKEFGEGLLFLLPKLSKQPGPRLDPNRLFTYTLCNILWIAKELGTQYSPKKQQLFALKVMFTGLC